MQRARRATALCIRAGLLKRCLADLRNEEAIINGPRKRVIGVELFLGAWSYPRIYIHTTCRDLLKGYSRRRCTERGPREKGRKMERERESEKRVREIAASLVLAEAVACDDCLACLYAIKGEKGELLLLYCAWAWKIRILYTRGNRKMLRFLSTSKFPLLLSKRHADMNILQMKRFLF